MQNRRRLPFGIAVALACVAGCASAPQAESQRADRPRPAKQEAEHAQPAPHQAAEPSGTPLLVPQIITLSGPAKLSRVSGACYVVRGEGGLPAQEGTVLQDGDVVDLGNAGENGAVSIQAGKSDIVLKRENGRFFKLQIRP